MSRERILVVANSRKTGRRCVAGVSLFDGRLVRPVSPHGSGALSDRECRVDGHTPRLLDVVSFAHCGPDGDPAQPENVVIADAPWKLEGPANRSHALALLLEVAATKSPLFVNRGRAVPETVAAEGLDASLALIEPAHLRFGHGSQARAHAGSPRALFRYGRQDWSLPVTDFDFGPRILRMPEGVHGWEDLGFDKPDRALLTASLGTAHEGWHHKLVAAVLRFG
ncbi:MAG TPA: hypothetical protein VG147_00560 [Solirubrobacteraceae bacterium]|jgi:hypothetical protein|nr:hypothetical protein [Solirubrobacteraceae bacterium]